MCHRGAGTELAALVTFATVSTKQNARIYYKQYDRRDRKVGYPAFFLLYDIFSTDAKCFRAVAWPRIYFRS